MLGVELLRGRAVRLEIVDGELAEVDEHLVRVQRKGEDGVFEEKEEE